jgi:hypothetical protein
VDGAQVGILEQANQVGLGGFLKKVKQKHTLSTDKKILKTETINKY